MSKELDQYVEDKIIELGEQIQKEIDFGILSDLLAESGWVKVKLDIWLSSDKEDEIIKWVDRNLTGDYHYYGSNFVFEKSEDASWFILSWKN